MAGDGPNNARHRALRHVQDKPLHVVFAHGSIFVVRARSICIFEEPQMVFPGDSLNIVLPRVSKSFGWVDGVALTLAPVTLFCPPTQLSLLVRNKGGDPWRPTEQFQFMSFNDNVDHTPSNTSSAGPEPFPAPFSLLANISSHHRGPLRCSNMVLGSHGTAVWIQPSDWAAAGLVTDNFIDQISTPTSQETLVVALFPGLLNGGSTEARVKVVLESNGSSWSCLDYDEARGLIALGSGSGQLAVYRL